MKKICFIGGKGAGTGFVDRVCGPERLPLELSKRLPDCRIAFASFQQSHVLESLRKIKRADILHGHGSLNMGLLLFFLKKIFDKKTILTFTDFKKNVTHNYKILNSLDAIVVLSQFAKKKLEYRGVNPTRIKVIPYGVEDSFYRAKNNNRIRKLGKKLVLYYGDARYERGFHILLKSIKYIPEDITLLICVRKFLRGFNPSLLNLKKKNVHFLQVKDYPCPIQDIIKSSDIVVLPFVHNTLEPPLSLMEVSAVGIPMITTDIGGNKEVVADGTVLLQECTPEKLARAITKHFSKKLKVTKSKIYSWDESLSKFEKLYSG